MKSMLVASGLLISVCAGLSGCLKTRTDVRETEQKQVIQQEVNKLQRTNADVSSRFSDVEDDMRNLRGRLEVLEHRGIVAALDGQQQQDAAHLAAGLVVERELTQLGQELPGLVVRVPGERRLAQEELQLGKVEGKVFRAARITPQGLDGQLGGGGRAA